MKKCQRQGISEQISANTAGCPHKTEREVTEMEFTGKKSVITPEGVFIIGTYDENGVPNAMNAAWGQQSDYGEITLFLGKH